MKNPEELTDTPKEASPDPTSHEEKGMVNLACFLVAVAESDVHVA